MNTSDNIKQMLDICQNSPITSASAGRLLARYESDCKRAFGSSGTVDAKVAMIDYYRELLARGLALLVIVAQGDMQNVGDEVEQIEDLGTVRHTATDLGTVIEERDGATIRTLPDDIRANIDRWKDHAPAEVGELPPIPGPADVGELPPMPAPADVGELPPMPAPADVGELPPIPAPADVGELPPIPAHPTRREHPARPSKGKRKPH